MRMHQFLVLNTRWACVKNNAWRENAVVYHDQVELRFRDVRFSVELSRTKAFFTGGKVGRKEILQGVSGVVGTGQILAIIGSSGAGKTSLLDILVGKVRHLFSKMKDAAWHAFLLQPTVLM